MRDLQGQPSEEPRPRRGRPKGLALGVAVAVTAFAASLAAMALAAGTAPTVSSLSSSRLGERIVVNAQGRTLYALSPETTHHLLCKSNECFKFWPPLTVGSSKTKLTAGPGVHGSLGILRRSGGMLQVTLRGLPLYRYYEDHSKGQTNGQGIKSFGGTWHAVTAASAPKTVSTSPESTSNTPSYASPSGGGGYESSATGSTTTTSTSTAPTSTSTTPTSTTPTSTTTKEEKPYYKEEPKEKAKEEPKEKAKEEPSW